MRICASRISVGVRSGRKQVCVCVCIFFISLLFVQSSALVLVVVHGNKITYDTFLDSLLGDHTCRSGSLRFFPSIPPCILQLLTTYTTI